MAITQRDRRHLHDTLAEKLGADEAAILMELLPLQPADQLVTISYFQTEMQAFRAELHADMADLKSELRADMADLKIELKTDMLRIENDLTLRMADLQTSFTRWVMALGSANVVAIVTALAT